MTQETRLVTREEWGAIASHGDSGPFLAGAGKVLVVHYTGKVGREGVPDDKPEALRKIQRMYQSGGRGDGQVYVDMVYSYATFNVDDGQVFEGRGTRMRGGANGTAPSNQVEPSVLVYVGTDDEIHPAVIRKLQWLTAQMGAHFGVDPQTIDHVGHRDRWATGCPGNRLYELAVNGAFIPPIIDPTDPSRPDNNQETDMPIYLTHSAKRTVGGIDYPARAVIFAVEGGKLRNVAPAEWTGALARGAVATPCSNEELDYQLLIGG